MGGAWPLGACGYRNRRKNENYSDRLIASGCTLSARDFALRTSANTEDFFRSEAGCRLREAISRSP
jgi:hypothetical protein